MVDSTYKEGPEILAGNLAARSVLRVQGGRTPWANFDAVWYLRTYPTICSELPDNEPTTVIRFYLERGQRLSHSPNLFFDETYFLARTPTAAVMVDVGQAESGFDAYCRARGRYQWPHWLYDEAFYRERYSDLTDATLQTHGLVNAYHHYLCTGNREGRLASLFFERTFYLDQLLPEERAKAEVEGPFVHYLHRLSEGERLVHTSIYFDPAWYLQHYPEIAEQIAAGQWLCPLHHYLANPTPTEFDPLPHFSERYYLIRYPDIRKAVEAGGLRNGYEHFLNSGAREIRSPSEAFDLHYYITAHGSVRADLDRGAAPHAFAHYLTSGHALGLSIQPPPDDEMTEGQSKLLFRTRHETCCPRSHAHPSTSAWTAIPNCP